MIIAYSTETLWLNIIRQLESIEEESQYLNEYIRTNERNIDFVNDMIIELQASIEEIKNNLQDLQDGG